jgi:RNA methyltransferase, TrmH family
MCGHASASGSLPGHGFNSCNPAWRFHDQPSDGAPEASKSRRMQRISSRHNPTVTLCRDIARGKLSTQILLDGAHLVSEAVAADIRVHQIIVASDALSNAHIKTLLGICAGRRVPIAAASAAVMSAISPVRSSSEIVAIAKRPVCDDGRLYPRDGALVIMAVDVQDPGNVGAIARVAEAGGASGMVAAGGSADPFGWKALRGSMGSALRLPIAIHKSVGQAMDAARGHGCQIVATIPNGGQSLFDLELDGPLAILIGGEGAGLADDLLAAADLRVSIPMQRPVESLNTAVAAGLLIYEARRQRLAKISARGR